MFALNHLLIRHLTLMLVVVLTSAVTLAAQEAGSVGELWGVWERGFSAVDPASPELEFQVILKSPSGREHTLDGFWDGGSTWRIRFMPSETGRWSYRTRSSPQVNGLSGIAGSFNVRQSRRRPNPLFRHGAVRVSSDRRRLEHTDGTPFFWLGDTAWNGPLLASPSDWHRYLQDRVAKKFTAIQFVMIAPWRTAPANAEGAVAFSGSQHIEINPRFFDRMDSRMNEINSEGLLAVPVLLWAIRGEENPGYSLPEDQAIRIERYLVARYGAHHTAWIVAGDGAYSGDFAERWKRIGRAVFGDRPHAPTLMHPGGMQWPYDTFRNETWLDLLGYQSGHGDDARVIRWIHSGPVSQAWRETPPRPVLNLEPPYEDHIAYQSKRPHSADNVRRAAYWSLLSAPVAGLTYGAHGIWSWETTAKVPLNHANSGTAKPWFEAILLPGSFHMKVLAEFFGNIAWWKLIPSDELLAHQPGSMDPAHFISLAASNSRDLLVAYLPMGGEISLNHAVSSFKATWVDPRTGRKISSRAPKSGTLRAPDSQDWLLLLRK